MATEIDARARYYAPSVSEQNPGTAAVEGPVDPLFSHAASPFERTEAPAPVAFASPPDGADVAVVPLSTWTAVRTPFYFGSAVLAYLMVLVGSVTVVHANPNTDWRYGVAVLPVIPAGLLIFLTVRTLARIDEVQKRTQMQAIGFSFVTTALLTFAYGFLESAGMPDMNMTFVLPLMALLWGAGLTFLNLRTRFHR